jgi:hypothetical protein
MNPRPPEYEAGGLPKGDFDTVQRAETCCLCMAKAGDYIGGESDHIA